MAIATFERRATVPHTRLRYVLILAAIAGGALLQHALVTLPLEPVPAAPRVAAPAAALNTPARVPPAPSRMRATIRNLSVHTAPKAGTAPHASSGAAAAIHAPARVQTVAKAARPQAPAPAVAAPPPQQAPPSDAALTASIQRAFNAYALPYQVEAALIVAVARQFGIDPAIPAALFMHEDGNINNRAEFPTHFNALLYHTRNPGNIKCMYQPCYDGFQVYPSYRAGILDWFRLYDHYYYDLGIHDLARFVATYCPPNVDGNGPPALYQSDVMTKATQIRAGWQGQ